MAGNSMTVLFIRGLNTFGDENFRIGPLSFGLVHKNLQKNLLRRGINLVPLLGMDKGTLAEQTDRAVKYLISLKQWQESSEAFHVLGHSMGGLIARAMVHNPEVGHRILSVTTIGTPHRGTKVAEYALSVANDRPKFTRFMKMCGYDLNSRIDIFCQFTLEALHEFNMLYPNVERVSYASIDCETPREKIGLPLRYTHSKVFKRQGSGGDGFVSIESQTWAKQLARFQLDHHAQLGFFFQLSPKQRREARSEFLQLLSFLTEYWKCFNMKRTG